MEAPSSSGARRRQEFALPRALDINIFAASREPEITALAGAVQTSEFGAKYGVEGIPRHLRRRTKSHNSYSHRRRPNVSKQADKDELGVEDAGDAPSFTNRKMRRRPGKLNEAILDQSRWTEASVLASSSPSCPQRRLETHVWQAKRLAMQPLGCGWVVPLGEPGKGRGSRAFARRISGGAVLHDASYWCPLLVSGPADDLRRCLERVVDPAIIAALHRDGWAPGWEEDAVLHAADAFPRGTISPVRIWSVSSSHNQQAAAASVLPVRLCIWTHGLSAAAAFKALKTVVSEFLSVSLQVVDLRRIEVRGAGADAAVARSLFQGSSNNGQLPRQLCRLKPQQASELALLDPRLGKPKAMGAASASLLGDREAAAAAAGEHSPVYVDILTPNYPAPINGTAINQARHHLRQLMVVHSEQEAPLVTGTTHCSAVFVRRGRGGWSIVLPPGWVKHVWLALIFQGCRATGQREWRWLHTLEHHSFYPHDAPDTAAYADLMRRAGTEQNVRAKSASKKITQPHAAPEWCALLSGNGDPALLENSVPFIARSEFTMLQALFGASIEPLEMCSGVAARPVTNALSSGRLHWTPKAAAAEDSAERRDCFVETLVCVVKRGVAAERAVVCVIAGEEGERSSQVRYLQTRGGKNEFEDEFLGEELLDPARLIYIGYITSAAPYGTGRAAASVAVCSAAAVWRLRSLQYHEARRDKGEVQAWVANPGSSKIFPVRLSLPVEK